MTKLTKQILNDNWSEIYDFNDVNLALHYLVETINKLKNNSTTEVTISSKTKKLKPWATTAIINSIRQRDRLHIQVRKFPLNLKFKSYYIRFRNKLTNVIKDANIAYYIQELIYNLNGK